MAAVRYYFIDTLQVADLAALRQIGAAVANRTNPARPLLHGLTDLAAASVTIRARSATVMAPANSRPNDGGQSINTMS